MKVVKHTYRYVVQYRSWNTGWIEDTSFKSLGKARRYVKRKMKYQPWEYQVVDTEDA